MLKTKCQCPACRGTLRPGDSHDLICGTCGETVGVIDGIVDFARGRFGSAAEGDDYDRAHQTGDARAAAYYDQIRLAAGERWPASLGDVLEVGCGTGLLTRGLAGGGEARLMVATDISGDMLRTCRAHLERLGLVPARPVLFATYSGAERCFRDVAFDTCAGAQMLHHVNDVGGFLADIYRCLRPGGRAFFIEPNRRFHRALMQALADIAALLIARDPAQSDDLQLLLNQLASARQRLLLQDDPAALATLEDKLLFTGEAFEDMALGLGFATAEAIPLSPDQTGMLTARRLCAESGISDAYRQEIANLMPSVGARYFALLARQDTSPSLLLWMTKRVGPWPRRFQAPPPEPRLPGPEAPLAAYGGQPPHWFIELLARPSTDGLTLTVGGWCLAAADVKAVRITLDGATVAPTVWLPRPDVHLAMNQAGRYPAWNALCCGLSAEEFLPGAQARDGEVPLRVEIVLASGIVLPAEAPPVLRLNEKMIVAA